MALVLFGPRGCLLERKSDVFLFAALHSNGEARARFLERADFFFRHSLETLDGFETKSYTRPVILLMHYGIMRSWFDRNPDATRPDGPPLGDVGAPEVFVPQKTRALKRLKMLAGAGALVGLVGGILIVRALLT